MKAAILLLTLSALATSTIHSQEQRVFNQNASRSNHTRIRMQNNDPWSFGAGTGASLGLKSNENTIFRGNSMASKIFGRYYFGNAGLGLTTGIIPGTISKSSLDQFIVERKFPQDQLQVTKSNPFNSYLLFGPSFRFGGKVYFNADVQGGLFFNNPGAVNIGQLGAQRPYYRFDGGDKNIFPGFSGSFSINYPVNNTTHFFINADYLQSKSSIRLLDLQTGNDVATQVNKNVKLLTTGIGIIKSFGGHREPVRKHIGNVKYEEISAREAGSGIATGKRILHTDDNMITTPRDAANGLPTGKRRLTVSDDGGFNNDAVNNGQTGNYCGTTSHFITHPDGTTEEMRFSCPADAIAYAKGMNLGEGMPNRISMNVTTPRQTQGTSFGEKVMQGIISGTIRWTNDNSYGIVTNEMAAVSSVGTISGSGSGAASASYAATGRMMNNANNPQSVTTVIYAREAGSGQATGRRSREAGSGIATGKRQYSPVFNETDNNSCSDCAVTAKLIAHELTHVIQQSPASISSNPLYNGSGTATTNPLYESKNRTANSNSECGVKGQFLVILINAENGQPVAKTKTDSCGGFWFANVPQGNYVVRVKTEVVVKKAYSIDINNDGKYDIAGEMLADNNRLLVQLQTEFTDNNETNDKVIVRGWDPEKKEPITGSSNRSSSSQSSLTGGAIPGAAIISSAFVAGNPIGGIVVKGGRNPGGSMMITQTNEYGEFEFSNLEKGNYTISTDFKYAIDEGIAVTLDADNSVPAEHKVAVQDHNSSRSNKSASFVENDPDNTGDSNKLKAQNNNTVRSNRTELKSILVEADTDGDGDYETDITGKINDEIAIDENGTIVAPQQKAGISTSRSNIIRSRSAIHEAGNGLYICYATAIINNKETAIRNILKAKHETAKNSVSNIR